MAKLSQEVKDYVRDVMVSVAEQMTTRERNKLIIDEVKRKFDVLIDSDDIYEIAVRSRKLKELTEALNEQTSDEKLYEVVNDTYHFIKDDKVYKIPVKEIDEMFYDFSSKGGNLTGEQMLQKYELKPEVWHMIKNRLRLYKASNVISPYTAENTPEEKLDKMVEEATVRHIDTLKHKMVKTHEVVFKAEAKKAMKTLSNVDYFLENVQKFISEYKPKTIEFQKPIVSTHPVLTIGITDFHFGKIGTHRIVNRMNKVRDYILSQPNTQIEILSLGDLAECFVEGGMHPGQSDTMELHGFDLMLFIADIFQHFLTDLYTNGKTVRMTGIGGNHDRLGRTHSDDMARTGALVVYELIKRGLSKSEIEVNILREKINSFDVDGTRFIIAHGDDGFSNKKPEDILWKNGNNQTHNVIMFGDKHNFKVQETKNGTMIGLPALAGKGEYDKRLDLHSEPGFVVVENNAFGSVDVYLKRLP